jgi:hypothetical protein
MKLTVDAKSFVEAAGWSTKSFDTKDDKAFVALHLTEGGAGFLSHTNNTSYMKSPLTVLSTEFEEGEDPAVKLALDGRYVQRLAGALGGENGPVVFSRKAGDTRAALHVASASGKFTIPLADADVPSEPKLYTLGEVTDVEYFDALQRLAKLCDPVNAGFLPAIGAVDLYLDRDEKTLTLMATDRYALGEVVIDFAPAESGAAFFDEAKHVLLPYETAILIAPSKGSSSQVEFVHEKRGQKFGYSFTDGRIALFSLSNTTPIAYKALMENAAKDLENSITLQVADLKKALGIVSSLAWDEPGIYFEIASDGLAITDSSKSNRFAVATSEVDVQSDQRVKFVRAVINEAFNPVSTATVRLRWNDEARPFILEPLLDDGTVQDNVFVLAIPSVN